MSSVDHEGLGVFLSFNVLRFALMGVMTHQMTTYFRNFPHDPWWQKLWISSIVALDSLNAVGNIISLWGYLITFYGDGLRAAGVHWIIPWSGLTEDIAAFLSQLWYIRRLYRLDKRYLPLCMLITAISLTSLAGGLYSIWPLYRATKIPPWEENVVDGRPVGVGLSFGFVLWGIAGVVVDALIVIPSARVLLGFRSGFKNTDTMLTRMTVWILNTGLLTSVVALIMVILYFFQPNGKLYFGMASLLCALYANSILAFLNKRRGWDGDSQNTGVSIHEDSLPLTSLRLGETSRVTTVITDEPQTLTYPPPGTPQSERPPLSPSSPSHERPPISPVSPSSVMTISSSSKVRQLSAVLARNM